MKAITPTQLHPSEDFLLSKEGVNSIPQNVISDTAGSLCSTRLQAYEHTSNDPSNMSLLDAATSFSINGLPTSTDIATTKRIHDIFLSGTQEPNPRANDAPTPSRSYLIDNKNAIGPASLAGPSLFSKLTTALRENESLAAAVQMLKEENSVLRKTSVLTTDLTATQRDFNATSINLLEEIVDDEQSKERTIVSLRTTASSLERQNRELESHIKAMQEQLSTMTLAKLDDTAEISETTATAHNLHWQLDAAKKQISMLTNELKIKDTVIEALKKDINDMEVQMQRFMNVNSTLTRCISEAKVSEASIGSVSNIDLQGKLEMYRLMNKQYANSMETLLTEQKATEDMLSLLMERAQSMNSRLDNIESKVVAVSRDRLVDIYRRRLEAAGLYVNG